MSSAYRSRCLLHRLDESDFKAWLEETGWTIHLSKGPYERIRARKAEKWLIIFDRNRGDHFTVRGEDYPIVREFYNGRKEYDIPPSELATSGRALDRTYSVPEER